MQGPQWLSSFVNGIYSDLGERSDYSEGYLTSWFLDQSNLGAVNNQIDTCFKAKTYCQNGIITGYGIEPEMGGEELAIYKANFDVFFYGREAKLTLKGSYDSQSWTSLKEGDSQITKINKSDLARTFNLLQKDAQANVQNLIREYLRNKTHPQSVNGDDTVSGGVYYAGGGENNYYYPRSQPEL